VRVETPPEIYPTTGSLKRRQPSKAFSTKKEANAALAKWFVEIERGTAVEPSKLTVAQLLDNWLTTVARDRVKPTTLEDYTSTIKKHILPSLGSTLVQRLTAGQVQALYATKRSSGTGSRTV
jgi:integrase